MEIRNKLAERAAFWRDEWIKEKESKTSVWDVKRKKHIKPDPKWGFIRRTVDENFPSMKDKKQDVSANFTSLNFDTSNHFDRSGQLGL